MYHKVPLNGKMLAQYPLYVPLCTAVKCTIPLCLTIAIIRHRTRCEYVLYTTQYVYVLTVYDTMQACCLFLWCTSLTWLAHILTTTEHTTGRYLASTHMIAPRRPPPVKKGERRLHEPRLPIPLPIYFLLYSLYYF